ncbi:MAG: PQQ-binding-like beta-propeller repeat protein [Deltaproteobacteria bacterium]|nr:PQQ-binding-like beta-propeller repeat protein [Deltaproteobacteria bacterium]
MKIRKTVRTLFAAGVFFWFALGAAHAADWPMFLQNANHDMSVDKAPQPPYRLKWSFRTKGAIHSSPVVSGGRLFIGSYDNSLYALDAATGAKLWSFKTGGEILSTPAVHNDAVYFGSKDGYVYALNAQTGALVWKYETDLSVVSSPVVTDELVIISSNDSYLYALSTADGKRQWRLQLYDAKYTGVYSSPALVGDAVFYSGKNGALYSSSIKSGGRNWQFPTSSAIYASPVVKDGIVYIVSYDRVLYAIDLKGEKVLWKKRLGKDMIGYASTVVEGESVYQVYKNGVIKVYRKSDGRESAAFIFPAGIKSTPVVGSNGIMIFGGEDGVVYAASSKTGAVIWEYKTGAPIHSSPAVVDNMVYIGSEDGTIYAFAP